LVLNIEKFGNSNNASASILKIPKYPIQRREGYRIAMRIVRNRTRFVP
jgi:hypothetical protein